MKRPRGAALTAAVALAIGLASPLVTGAVVRDASVAAPAQEADPLELGRLRAENARLRHALRAERARSAALLSELARQGRARLERELAWRDLHAQLGRLRGVVDPAAVLAEALDLEVAEERRERTEREARARADLEARRDRAERVRLALNARLRVEGFDGFDLFEAGLLAADRYRPVAPMLDASDPEPSNGDGASDDGPSDDGVNGDDAGDDATGGTPAGLAFGPTPDARPAFGTGPVVLRLFDHRGVLSGSIVADRLHLEASRSGHSVTLVLTDGHSRVDDRRLPFDGGVYRIPLRHVDPVPFIEACGPLFDPERTQRVVDDGRWSRPALLLTLNRLLEASDRTGRYRLTWLGGVVGDEFREVELTVRDAAGRETERLIADRLVVELHGDHARLVLRDGLALAGDGARAPFRDGRRSIVLVDSDPRAYASAHLPVVFANAADAIGATGESDDATDANEANDTNDANDANDANDTNDANDANDANGAGGSTDAHEDRRP